MALKQNLLDNRSENCVERNDEEEKKRTEGRCVIRNISILNINVNMLKRLEILKTVAKKNWHKSGGKKISWRTLSFLH